MGYKIHILGASGSGTTTLGGALGDELGFIHFDTDDYFWEKTEPPYVKKREISERIRLIRDDISGMNSWILSGSLCGWGDELLPEFDLIIFLYIPKEVRMKRLMEREIKRYADEIKPGGEVHEAHKVFMDWASLYDDGGMNVRSKQLHYAWLEESGRPVLMLEEDISVEERVLRVKEFLGTYRK